uniref:Uncharacterized protein n=1 Tax=Rhipicephalus pulchellus TaxID=72859 RepID=L7LU93_RHIPC
MSFWETEAMMRSIPHLLGVINLQLKTTAQLMCASLFSNAVCKHNITIPCLILFEYTYAKLNTGFAENWQSKYKLPANMLRGKHVPRNCK